ncbi:MAG: serine--tRNA ligase [Gemmatimonadota bacterium]
MLDLKAIRADYEGARDALARRADAGVLDELDACLALDDRRRDLIGRVEVLKARRNEVSRLIGERRGRGEQAEDEISDMREVGEQIRALDAELAEVRSRLDEGLLRLPNLPDARVPPGGEDDYEIVAEHGEVGEGGKPATAHWDLGERLGALDLERGARIAGSGFPLLWGAGARLARGLVDFMLDLHTAEHGYVEVSPPYLVNRASLTATGHLPKYEEDVYRTAADDLFLVPTAEVPLTNLHRDEILAEADLPLAYVAYTPCFRREAGAAGRDTRGLLRVHQFDKVELVRFCAPNESEAELELLTRHAEVVLQRLELPYRRILLAAGDLGFANAITYDLEVWSAGVGRWLEVSSCSSYTDYQARRAGIRFRPAVGGGTRFVHTLNGSGVALARTIVALLENNQEADGGVRIPAALQPYVRAERLDPP